MTIKVKYTAICDGCGKQVTRKYSLSKDYEDDDTDGTDIWTPGIPRGWMQIVYDELTDKHYLFFHNGHCFQKWLKATRKGIDKGNEWQKTRPL